MQPGHIYYTNWAMYHLILLPVWVEWRKGAIGCIEIKADITTLVPRWE